MLRVLPKICLDLFCAVWDLFVELLFDMDDFLFPLKIRLLYLTLAVKLITAFAGGKRDGG